MAELQNSLIIGVKLEVEISNLRCLFVLLVPRQQKKLSTIHPTSWLSSFILFSVCWGRGIAGSAGMLDFLIMFYSMFYYIDSRNRSIKVPACQVIIIGILLRLLNVIQQFLLVVLIDEFACLLAFVCH